MLNSYFMRKDIMRDTIKEYIELSDKEKTIYGILLHLFLTPMFS